MVSKTAKAAMTNGHTAGIYADMTVDGPDIGTLVVIVDRAKNLPNRKTMGKQDPYCAARLGKEAKKTETDRRGGQTPRWDQELRFVVHDSPDYHQLKVSVFNDDRRTDLIGETWVSLETVVVPGGGQNDLWHSLNCKGKYAGEIRIELTYYDSRSKVERIEQPNDISSTVESQDPASVAVGGPRGPKPSKRRPLPADPTTIEPTPIQSVLSNQGERAELPYIPGPIPHGNDEVSSQYDYSTSVYCPQTDAEPLDDYGLSAAPSSLNQYSREPYEIPSYAGNSSSTYPPFPYQQQQQPKTYPAANFLDENSPAGFDNQRPTQNRGRDDRPAHMPIHQRPHHQSHRTSQQYHYQGVDLPQLPPHPSRAPRPFVQPPPSIEYRQDGSRSSLPGALPQNRSFPRFPQQQQQRFQREDARHSLPNPAAGPRYQANFARHKSFEDDSILPQPEDFESEGPPPPPPAHRSSRSSGVGNSNRWDQSEQQQQNYHAASAPPPLNIRHGRQSMSASSYSQEHVDVRQDPYAYSTPPSSAHSHSRSGPQTGPYPVHTQRPRVSSIESTYYNAPHNDGPPPSLVAGYDPLIADAESERMRWEQRASRVPAQTMVPFSSPERSPVPQPEHINPPAQYNNHSPSLPMEDTRPQPTSAPIIKPRAISPNPQTPIRKSVSPDPRASLRKSVSPQPDSAAMEQRFSAFSPDSYDTLNPNLSSAKSINVKGPQYNTPEQARDAAQERLKEDKLEEGPIIGSDGRVIDPSDHLPPETWAAEPEPKPARKGPEITFRFRNSPKGANPMPASGVRAPRETVIRPHVITASHAYSADSVSPTAATRNRLQKKTRESPTHAASSPSLPTSNTASPASHPLQEHGSYGYNSSPGYARGSPTGPPPIPAKVPLGSDREDWGANALSEEIQSIDIGVGSGGRARRSVYGR